MVSIKIDLNKNFRSREEVINNINLMFNRIMDDDIGGASYKESHQMVYGNLMYKEKVIIKKIITLKYIVT